MAKNIKPSQKFHLKYLTCNQHLSCYATHFHVSIMSYFKVLNFNFIRWKQYMNIHFTILVLVNVIFIMYF